MKKNKAAFTITEVLVATISISLIITMCCAMMSTMSSTVVSEYNNVDNRDALYSNLSYITREIQSAEAVKLSNGGKKISIRQKGTDFDEYTVNYEIKDGEPFGGLYISGRSGGDGKKIMDLDYTGSSFSANSGTEYVNFSSYDSSTKKEGYTSYYKKFTEISRLGTSKIRIHFPKINMESTYDTVLILDKRKLDKYIETKGYDITSYELINNATLSELKGVIYTNAGLAKVSSGTNYYTSWFNTDSVYIVAVSDSSVHNAGYEIDYFQYDNTTNAFGKNTVDINLRVIKDPSRVFDPVIMDYNITVASRNSNLQVE